MTKQHWEKIYKTKDTSKEVSWYQDNPQISINLILSTNIDKNGNIIDIGGGDSKLTGKLLELGFKNLFVLDISGEALAKAKLRLGAKAKIISWIESDILKFKSNTHFDIWHDRATFHFLTKKENIMRYIKTAGKLVKSKGYLIISTFSANGPKKCSGLDIMRYNENTIKETFKEKFNLIKSFVKIHTTPFNTKQKILHSIFKKK